jgi:hypothetical protein
MIIGMRGTHNEIILNTVGLAPGTHDPVVIGGDEDDLVDALGLELVLVVDVRGDVLLLACRGEGPRDGDDDDLLLLGLLSRMSGLACVVCP